LCRLRQLFQLCTTGRDAYAVGMVSYLHELIVLLFRNRSNAAPDLLRELDVDVPDYDQVCVESADLNDLQPAEYRADLVLILAQGPNKVLGVVVEVQLSRNEEKRYSWPAYVANLRARHRCPVCLLVITLEESVARWAEKSIELGPGNCCTPWVVSPSNMPTVTELQEAERNVELAVLSAIEHRNDADAAVSARITSTAVVASAGVAEEASRLYLDLIRTSLRRIFPTMPEVAMTRDELREYFKDPDRYIKIVKMEARDAAYVAIILKQLAQRFKDVPFWVELNLNRAPWTQLDAVAGRILTAQTLNEALSPLS